MRTKSDRPWLATIESPVVRLWETSVSCTAGPQHFQHLAGRAGQSASDFLAHAHQTPFRTANPNFSRSLARPIRKKPLPVRNSLTRRLKSDNEEDLHDLVLDSRRPAESVRSRRDSELNSARSNYGSSLRATYSSLSEVRKRDLIFQDLREHISTRASVPSSLVPASQTLHSFRKAHAKTELRNPTVAQFLSRFDRKPVAKVAKMGRRGFLGNKLIPRTGKTKQTETASSAEEQDTYVEYFTLKPA